MKYGSPESVRFTEEVAREMAVAGWEAGLELAREKGPAPIMNDEFVVTKEMLRKRPEMKKDGWKVGARVPGRLLHARYSRYMQRIATVAPQLVDDLAQVGARFTHHTSIAPTGTISLSLANNASNGIEPSFAHHYFRNVIREGRKTKEKVDVFSFELLAYRELINREAMPNATEGKGKLPDYFSTADEVTPTQHVDIQAAAQMHEALELLVQRGSEHGASAGLRALRLQALEQLGEPSHDARAQRLARPDHHLAGFGVETDHEQGIAHGDVAGPQGLPDHLDPQQPDAPIETDADLETLSTTPKDLYVDFYQRLRQNGVAVEQALFDSARLRLLPILITTATTVLGMLPLVGRLFTEMHKCHPAVSLKILEGSSGQVEEWLADARVDIAILYRYGSTLPELEQSLAVVDSYKAPGGPDCMDVSADGKLIYVTSRWAKKLSVIDTATRALVRQVPVGRSPHGVWTLDHAKRF